MAAMPQTRVATADDAGRSCPYCRFPIKQGAEVAACGVCGAPHHMECWDENGGCAVVACAGGPGSVPAPSRVSAPGGYPTPAQAPAPAPYWPPPQRRSARGWLIGAAVLVVLAAAGAAVAIVIEKQKHPAAAPLPPQTVTAVETKTIPARPAPQPKAVPRPVPKPRVLPAFGGETRAQMTQEITDVLYQHHEDIVTGDFRAAWALLSTRKQQQNLAKYGYATWQANQATLSPYLDPSGIQVRIIQLNPRTGEATVDVTGMTWSKPGAHCSEWSGITWMLYQDGEWRYDPGYSTTPQRTAEWQSRYSELLGGSC